MESLLSQHPHAAVVALTGELDAHTVGRLRSLLAEQLLAGPGNLVIDLSGLTFIDSAGLAALIAADKGVRRAGTRMVLAAPGAPVSKVLRLTGLDALLTTTHTVDEALALLVPDPRGASG